jgi:hypothetical protein
MTNTSAAVERETFVRRRQQYLTKSGGARR